MVNDKWIIYAFYYPTNWESVSISFLSRDCCWEQELEKAETFDSYEKAESFMDKARAYVSLSCPRIDLHPDCRYNT